jgi:hypothetical protein
MRALATRELIVAARTAAVPLAALTILGLLTAFVLAWSPGVPVLAPMNLYEQARVLHWMLLAAVLPWIAVRSSSMDRGDVLVMTAAFIGLRPASVVAAKVLAVFTVLLAVVLTGLPALVLAQQAAAASIASVFVDLLPLLGLALLIAASSTASILLTSDGLRAWLWASGIVTAILVAEVGLASEFSIAGVFCGAAGVAATACLCSTAGRFLTYLGSSDAA